MTARLFLILFLLSCHTYCACQDYQQKDFKRFTTSDGLSNNSITDIQQDSNGYIWIATSRGLNRFDGTLFKQYFHSDDEKSLPDNKLFSLKLLPGDRLAVATDNGIQIINSKTLSKKNLYIPGDDALKYWTNACRFVQTDGSGNLGISTKTGLYVFSAGDKLENRYDHYKSSDVGTKWMSFGRHLFALPDGNLIQTNASGILMYNSSNNSIANALDHYPGLREIFRITGKTMDYFSFIAPYKALLLNTKDNSFDVFDIRTGKIRSIPTDLSLQNEVGWQTRLVHIRDDLWAINSKYKGFFLLKINEQNNQVDLLPERQLSEHLCTILFPDSHKRLWVGTDEGLFMQDIRKPIIRSFVIDSKKNNENISISSLHITGKFVFAGTHQSKILVLDKKTRQLLKTFPTGNANELVATTSFFQIHPDTLWAAATISGIYWINLKNFSYGKVLPEIFGRTNSPYKFYSDQIGAVWISTLSTNLVYYYDVSKRTIHNLTKNNQPLLNINLITSFASDKNGNIWLGGDGIARWNRKTKKIDTVFTQIPGQKNEKIGFTLMDNGNGEIWSTMDNGRFANLTSPEITFINHEYIGHDLSPSAYPSIFNDQIFMTADNGVGLLNIKDLKGVIFHTDDGIPQHGISTVDFYPDNTDKSVWFASRNIICVIPYLQNEQYLTPPSLNISELAIINDTTIHYPGQDVSLKYFQNDINVSLNAINYSDPKNMRFAYRFKKDIETDWIPIGTQHNILLTNISPGTYNLQVKVYANDNKWPAQQKEIFITIKPPFWKTNWFVFIVIAVIAAALYFLYKNRINQVKQKASIDKLLAQTEMKALHAQMNPHFIFNCLNSIREMILNIENEQASLYLSKFARLIRITLNQSSKQFVSLADTIDYLERYLEMEKIRSAHFSYMITVDKDLHTDEIILPPMLIQPFIENAIWHGSPHKKNMHISIRFDKTNNDLICTLDDNGIGIEESLKKKETLPNDQSVGIANIRQRIELLNEKYNLQSTIKIEDKSVLNEGIKTGTTVTLKLPIKTHESLWTT